MNETLLQAVLASPDDEHPRLVYADWLSEQGDPRGELISVQCALAASQALDGLTELHLRRNVLGSDSVQRLRARFGDRLYL